MLSERSTKIIEKTPGQLQKPVRLILFTTDSECMRCTDAAALARAIKNHMSKIALETYDMVMDRDKTRQYGIQQAPAIVVQGGEGQAVTFYGFIEDVFLEILMNTIQALVGDKIWFPDDVQRALKRLSHDVPIRVFVESDCARCRPVAETAIGLALESRFIYTDIIIASDFPSLIKKYHITDLPKTIFGENLHMDGHVTESEFLEMIFEAEGIKIGPDRKCLVCGKLSPELICANCKNRIQAEAVEHKLKGERPRHTDTL